MLDLMLDIETLATGPDAVIAAIGCAFFTPGEPEPAGPVHVWQVAWDDQDDRALDPRTVAWWLEQSDTARAQLLGGERVHLNVALLGLSTLLRGFEGAVWTRGAFDCPVLAHAYRQRCLTPTPWHFRQERDLRTVLRVLQVPPGNRPPNDDRHTVDGDVRAQIARLADAWPYVLRARGEESSPPDPA